MGRCGLVPGIEADVKVWMVCRIGAIAAELNAVLLVVPHHTTLVPNVPSLPHKPQHPPNPYRTGLLRPRAQTYDSTEHAQIPRQGRAGGNYLTAAWAKVPACPQHPP